MAAEERGGQNPAVLLHHRLHARYRYHLPHLPTHPPRPRHPFPLHEVHLPQVRMTAEGVGEGGVGWKDEVVGWVRCVGLGEDLVRCG